MDKLLTVVQVEILGELDKTLEQIKELVDETRKEEGTFHITSIRLMKHLTNLSWLNVSKTAAIKAHQTSEHFMKFFIASAKFVKMTVTSTTQIM